MKVLLIDFYDSFTYNIHHYLVGLGADVDVIEDKGLDIDLAQNYDVIIFSPGPGLPQHTQSLYNVLERYGTTKRILGICLGMQGIAQFYGGSIYNQKVVKHGVSEVMHIVQPSILFNDLPTSFIVGLYHSWAVDITGSDKLEVLARSQEGVVMAIWHKELDIFGMQFHPESILTEYGKNILANFLFS